MGQQWSVEDRLKTELTGVEEVSVRMVAGEVVVTATDGPTRLEIDHVERGPVEVSFTDGVLSIHQHGAERGGFLRRIAMANVSAKVLIAVPASTAASLATVSADVVLAGLSEPADVKTVSGDVTMKDLGQRIEARSVSGSVEAFGVSGDLTISTVSGDIGIVNGTCKWLQAKTVSGDFTLDLALPQGSNYAVGTVSGDVLIRFPHDPSVRIDASSMSGEMRMDFGEPARRAHGRPSRFQGVLGSGASHLSIKTLSGEVRIARKMAVA